MFILYRYKNKTLNIITLIFSVFNLDFLKYFLVLKIIKYLCVSSFGWYSTVFNIKIYFFVFVSCIDYMYVGECVCVYLINVARFDVFHSLDSPCAPLETAYRPKLSTALKLVILFSLSLSRCCKNNTF